jgi:hypothetical protein
LQRLNGAGAGAGHRNLDQQRVVGVLTPALGLIEADRLEAEFPQDRMLQAHDFWAKCGYDRLGPQGCEFRAPVRYPTNKAVK